MLHAPPVRSSTTPAPRAKQSRLDLTAGRGSGDFRGLHVVVTRASDRGDRFQVVLDECPAQAHACAIALIKRQKDELVIGREVRWFTQTDGPGVQDVISRAYRLGMKWIPGRKQRPTITDTSVRPATRSAAGPPPHC